VLPKLLELGGSVAFTAVSGAFVESGGTGAFVLVPLGVSAPTLMSVTGPFGVCDPNRFPKPLLPRDVGWPNRPLDVGAGERNLGGAGVEVGVVDSTADGRLDGDCAGAGFPKGFAAGGLLAALVSPSAEPKPEPNIDVFLVSAGSEDFSSSSCAVGSRVKLDCNLNGLDPNGFAVVKELVGFDPREPNGFEGAAAGLVPRLPKALVVLEALFAAEPKGFAFGVASLPPTLEKPPLLAKLEKALPPVEPKALVVAVAADAAAGAAPKLPQPTTQLGTGGPQNATTRPRPKAPQSASAPP